MFNYSKFYRMYTHHLRKYYEVSQQNLAKAIEIPNSSLSKIEAGKQEMDEKTFKKVIDFFEKIDEDFRFSFNLNLVEEVESWIQKSVRAFVMVTYDSMACEIKIILENSKYLHSFAYFHILLLQTLYDNFLDIDCMENVRKLIETNYFRDDFHLAVLHDLYGVSLYSMNQKILKIQNESLKRALGYSQRNGADGLTGLILYHLIMNQKISGHFISCLAYFEECENCLQKANAYRRLIHFKLNKANLYSNLALYSLAEEIYKNLEYSSQSQVGEAKIIPKIYECYSWCAIKKGEYAEALARAKKAQLVGSRFPDIYITLAYANYKLKNFEASKQAISRFRNQFTSDLRIDFINQFFILLERVLEHKKIPDYLVKVLLKKLPDFHDVELEMVLYPFLTEYYQSIEDYKNASMIQSRWIDYLQLTTT